MTRGLAARLANVTAHGWRRALAAGAIDATALLSGRRLMVVAPHPDDETFGCGALIARARAAGDPVTVVVATDGRHSTTSSVLAPAELADLRAAELRSACGRLGVPDADLVTLGFEDGSLARYTPRLAARLGELLAERRPEVVLVPCEQDEHPDHRAVYTATVRAVHGYPGPCLLLAYPIWAWAQGPWFLDTARWGAWPGRVAWSARQLVAGGWLRVGCGPYLAAKRAAVAAYPSQLTNITGERSWRRLAPEFVSLFLRPVELFQPVLDHRDRPVTAPAYRKVGA
jgi:LmbE family N-acetylglucosaminyl deacetylase